MNNMEEKPRTDKMSSFLKEQSKIIMKYPFDLQQIGNIIKNMEIPLSVWKSMGKLPMKEANDVAESLFQFNLALQISYSNYRTQNKAFWSRIFHFGIKKMPQLKIPLSQSP